MLLSLGLAVLIFMKHRAWLMRQSPATTSTLTALLILPQAALHLWTLVHWGTIGGPQMVKGPPFTPEGFQIGALGLLVDPALGVDGPLLGLGQALAGGEQLGVLLVDRDRDLLEELVHLFGVVTPPSHRELGLFDHMRRQLHGRRS